MQTLKAQDANLIAVWNFNKFTSDINAELLNSLFLEWKYDSSIIYCIAKI